MNARRESALEEAQRVTRAGRESTYGHPAVNLERTAILWTAHLRARGLLASEAEIGAEDVCWMQAQLKQARAMQSFHRDNYVDAPGYIDAAHRIHEARGEGLVADLRKGQLVPAQEGTTA